MNTWTYGAWAFAAGMLIPVMAALSGGIGKTIGSPAWTAVILFAVALAAALAYAVVVPGNVAWSALGTVKPVNFAAGLVVVFYLLTVTYLAPRFGVAPTVMLVVVAQIITSAAISHFGWFGAPRQPFDLRAATGVALMLGGVMLIQMRRAA